jgi:hypothetical protein
MRTAIKYIIIGLIVGIATGGFFTYAFAAFNEEINYQGKLTGSSGVAVPNGDYCMKFLIYDDLTAGNLKWSETWNSSSLKVPIASGLFSVLMGSHTSFTNIFNDASLYLEVQFDPDTGCTSGDFSETFSPRKKLGSVPSAFQAGQLEGFTWAAPGTIGSGTPSTGDFTTLSASSNFTTSNGSILSSASGILTFGASGGANNENLTLDFETTSNTVAVASSTGVTGINLGSLGLTTTGTIGAGAITGTSFVIGADTLSSFTNLKSLEALSYSSASFVKMTSAGTFALDTSVYYKSGDSPSFANITDSGLTSSKLVFTDASKQLTSTGIGTSSQFIKGDGSLDSSTYQSALTFVNSIQNTTGTVNLLGDSTSPGNLYYYGTDGSGDKGFYALPSSMVYPGAGIPVSTGSAWGTSLTDNHSNWDSAYSHKTTEDAINGLVFVDGAGSCSAKAIGTDVQAYSANLASLAGLSYSSASFVKMTSAGTFALDTSVYYKSGDSPSFANITDSGDLSFGTTGARFSAASGILTLAGIGNTNNENLTLDFETTSNVVTVGTGTDVGSVNFGSLGLATTGNGTFGDLTSNGNTVEVTSNKNMPNGYAGLDENGDLVGIFIPRYDTESNLSSVVLEAGELASTSDTHTLFQGDGATAGGIDMIGAYIGYYIDQGISTASGSGRFDGGISVGIDPDDVGGTFGDSTISTGFNYKKSSTSGDGTFALNAEMIPSDYDYAIGLNNYIDLNATGVNGLGVNNYMGGNGSHATSMGMFNIFSSATGEDQSFLGVGTMFMGGSETTNISVVGIQNSIYATGAGSFASGVITSLTVGLADTQAYGESITFTVVGNNPTENQMGVYVNMTGNTTSDSGNKQWAIYNASTNAILGKVFLGVDDTKTYWGTGYDGSIYVNSDNFYIANSTQDKDIVFSVNDGGSTKTITLDADVFQLVSSTGTFDFSDDNLTTTGTIGAGAITGTSFVIGADTLSSFTNLKSLEALSYSSASFVKMTSAGTFALDTSVYYKSGDSPSFANITDSGNLTFGTTGASLSATSGILTLAGIGNTNNENLTLDLETTSNTVAIASGTGVTGINMGSLTLTTTGTLGAGAITGTSLNVGSGAITTIGTGTFGELAVSGAGAVDLTITSTDHTSVAVNLMRTGGAYTDWQFINEAGFLKFNHSTDDGSSWNNSITIRDYLTGDKYADFSELAITTTGIGTFGAGLITGTGAKKLTVDSTNSTSAGVEMLRASGVGSYRTINNGGYFYVDYSNDHGSNWSNRLKIGSANIWTDQKLVIGSYSVNPTFLFEMDSDAAVAKIKRYSNTGTEAPAFLFVRSGGTQASPSDSTVGMYLGKFQFRDVESGTESNVNYIASVLDQTGASRGGYISFQDRSASEIFNFNTRTKNAYFKYDNSALYFGGGDDVFTQYTGTYWDFDVAQATTAIRFNQSNVDTDFSIGTTGSDNTFYVDAGNDTVDIGSTTGVAFSAANGVLTLKGLKSAGNNENLTLDLETTADTVAIASGTGVTDINFGSLNITTSGKLTASGGIDPPYMLFDLQTREEVADLINQKVPLNKRAGATMFFNSETKKMEVFLANEGRFYDLNGNLLGQGTALETILEEGEISTLNFSSGSIGDGNVSGVSILSLSAKTILSSLGITLADGIANLKEVIATKISTQTARIGKMEMVDSATGDTYCAWIENGEWQKLKGDCSDATVATAQTKTDTPDKTDQTETQIDVQAQISNTQAQEALGAAQQAQQAAQQAQQAAQEAQQQAQQATEANSSAQDAANTAQQAQQSSSQANEEQGQIQTQPQSEVLNISSVAPISDINVAFGTAVGSTNLPTTVTATLPDATTQSVTIVWDIGTPSYDSNTAGTYVFSGTLTFSGNVTNTDNLKAGVNVVVAQAPPPPPEDNQNVELESSSELTIPPVEELIQEATSGLLNGIWNFVKWIFQNLFKKAVVLIPDVARSSSAGLSSLIIKDAKSDFSHIFLSIKLSADTTFSTVKNLFVK